MNEFRIHFLQTCARLFVCDYLSKYIIRTFVPFYNGLTFFNSRLFLQSFNHTYRAILLYRVYL